MKRFFNFLMLISLFAFSKTVFAQSNALSGYSDTEIAQGLLSGKFKHSDVPLERNENVYYSFRKEYMKKYHPDTKKGFYSTIPHNGLFSILSSKPAYIEVQNEQGDIFTWPVAFKNDNGSFVLYTDKMSPDNNTFAYYMSINGKNYPTVQVKMNMMRIGKKNVPKPIQSVLFSTSWDNVEVMNPKQAIVSSNSDKCLLSYSVIYEEKPSFARYPVPDYEIIAGKAFAKDRDIQYNDPRNVVGYLSVIDTRKMKAGSLSIALKGVPNPMLYGMFPRRSHIFCGNSSFYDITQYYSKNAPFKDSWRVISQNGTPIYILTNDWNHLEGSIIPGDGDVVFDIVENDDYFMYCGTNNKHGYVGFDNPTLVIIDKKTHEEVARYNSNLGTQRKGKVFSRIMLLSNNQLYLELLGVNGHSRAEQYGSSNDCIVEVISLSSLIN